ncbi:MAG TPA: DUF2177 family protein [bacterium]|nr:DUF2177 family protein [bacterium]HPL95753.1 DUF2177 family protein [bacterium]
MHYIFYYLATLIPLTVLDAVWLMVIAKGFYAERMGFLFQKQINFTPAVLFYLFYAMAVVFLAVVPALDKNNWLEALWRGALLGLAAYGAYDLTNQATIANWPVVVTIVDILWGILVTAAVSAIAFFIINYFK